MLATCRTAISQLPSTMICNNLTKCCGVYWNCRNWRNINVVTCKRQEKTASNSKNKRLNNSLWLWHTIHNKQGTHTPRIQHTLLISILYPFFTKKKMNDTWCGKSKNKQANWEEKVLSGVNSHTKKGIWSFIGILMQVHGKTQ